MRIEDLTPEEIVDAMMIPEPMTPDEKRFSDEEFRKFRMERIAKMTKEEREQLESFYNECILSKKRVVEVRI